MRENDTVLVIGGANGIGAACCEVMKAHGWSILVADKDEAAANEIAERLDGQAFALDVTDIAAIDALAERIDRDIGGPAALVVSSGIFQPNVPVELTPTELFDTIHAVNLRGTYHANRSFGMRMAARGRGAIVNMASATAHASTPNNIYGPGKAAIVNMTKCFAGEWGGRGVRVNSVSPGIVLVPRIRGLKAKGDRYPANLDEQMALRRCVEPREVAETTEFLASSRASGITGTDIVVDCGWATGALWNAYLGGLR
ncbi:MAG: SDR family oxidoreductase [Sphingomonas sp.]|uniref:SDR family NAD(P)-dependent oxidoreductase n=1 Tax=Sphingomonas sp. TaxID=28214 RepID=UPI0025F17560|nr:SDR family oxidoreductase [Sphingomonas sp.]MBX3564161.1 SDR family oxidoreductase [Sphingomonas sp.]